MQLALKRECSQGINTAFNLLSELLATGHQVGSLKYKEAEALLLLINAMTEQQLWDDKLFIVVQKTFQISSVAQEAEHNLTDEDIKIITKFCIMISNTIHSSYVKQEIEQNRLDIRYLLKLDSIKRAIDTHILSPLGIERSLGYAELSRPSHKHPSR